MRDVQRGLHRGLPVSLTGLALAGLALIGVILALPMVVAAVADEEAAPASGLLAEVTADPSITDPEDRCRAATRPSVVRRPPDAMASSRFGEISDWAVHPSDGRLYAVSTFGSLVRWDPGTSRLDSGFPDTVVPRGGYDSVVFDAAGNAYVERAEPRRVYQIDLRASSRSTPISLPTVDWARPLGDAPVGSCMPVADFGDAPAGYGTTRSAGGPSHRAGPRLRLGRDSTLEPDAIGSVAGGDGEREETGKEETGKPGRVGKRAEPAESAGKLDGKGDVGDDALKTLPPIEPYMSRYTLEIPYRNRLDGPATLAAWLDADLNGTFDRDERQVVVQGPGERAAELHWRLPRVRSTGTGYLRLRLYAGEIDEPGPTGAAGGPGEVEDHPLQIRGAPVSDLGVRALPTEVVPGGRGVLALLVRNEGPYDAEVDATIRVSPPKRVAFGHLPSNCRKRPDDTVECRLPARRLPAGGDQVAWQLPFQVSATAAPETALPGGVIQVDQPGDPDAANNSAGLAITTLPAVSDLSARMVREPYAGTPGRDAAVTVEVGNAGPSDTADPATLVLGLPDRGASFRRLPDGCRARGEAVRCAVPAGLAAGESQRFELPVRLASHLPAAARLSGGSAEVRLRGDPDRTNDAASYEVRTEEPRSSLSVVTVLGDSGRVAPGETFSYTVRLHNGGPSDASDVRLSQSLPAAVVLVGPLGLEGCTETGRRLRCTEAGLPAGSSAEYEVTARLSPIYTGDGSDLADTVTVRAGSEDSERSDNTARHRLPAGVAPPKIDVTVAVTTSGGQITPGTSDLLTVTAKNRGPSQTDGRGRHVISLPPGMTAPARLPDGCTVENGGAEIGCRIPAGLWPGAAARWTVPVQTGPAVPHGRIFTGGRVEVFGTRDPVARNDRTTFTLKAGKSRADLVMTKRPVKRKQIGPGGVFEYALSVTNSGPSNARNVVIRDRLPKELTYLRTDDGCRVRGRELACRAIALLRRGEFETRHVTVKLDPGYRGNGRRVAEVAEASSDTVDPETSNNQSALETSGLPGGLVVHPPADLSITVAAPAVPTDPAAPTGSGNELLPGETAEFELTVSNSGPFEAVHQSITGILPAPLRFVSSPDGCTATEQGFTCPPVESLGGGERLRRRVTLRLDRMYGGDGSDLAAVADAGSFSLDPDRPDNSITWFPMRSTA